MSTKQRVYILTDDPVLAAASDYGPGWEHMWQDPEGRRLLPFCDPPDGLDTMTLEQAQAYQATFDIPAPYEPDPEVELAP